MFPLYINKLKNYAKKKLLNHYLKRLLVLHLLRLFVITSLLSKSIPSTSLVQYFDVIT